MASVLINNTFSTDSSSPSQAATIIQKLRKIAGIALAFVFLVLAVAGAFLPLLPCTPFVLLASYFLLKSSPSLHRRLLQVKGVGEILDNWNQHRAITRQTKLQAMGMVVGSLCLTSFVAGASGLLLLGMVGGGSVGALIIWCLPEIRA